MTNELKELFAEETVETKEEKYEREKREYFDRSRVMGLELEWRKMRDELCRLAGSETAPKGDYFDAYARCKELALQDLYVAAEQIPVIKRARLERVMSKKRMSEFFVDKYGLCDDKAMKFLKGYSMKSFLMDILLLELFLDTKSSVLAFAIHVYGNRCDNGLICYPYKCFFEVHDKPWKNPFVDFYDWGGLKEEIRPCDTDNVHRWLTYAIEHETNDEKRNEYLEYKKFYDVDYRELLLMNPSGSEFQKDGLMLFEGRKHRKKLAFCIERLRLLLSNGKMDYKYLPAVKKLVYWESLRPDRDYKRLHDLIQEVYHLEPGNGMFNEMYYYTKHYKWIKVMQILRPITEIVNMLVLAIPFMLFYLIRGAEPKLVICAFVFGLLLPFVVGVALPYLVTHPGLLEGDGPSSGGGGSDFGTFLSGYIIGKYM